MNRILSILFLALLVSCKPQAPEAKARTSSPSPQATASATPSATKELANPETFVGVWEVKDEDNDAFNIILCADGRSIANWSNGRNGGRGERGQWHASGQEVIIFHRNGFTDCFMPQKDGTLLDRGYSPGSNILDIPASKSPVKRIDGDLALYSCVWRLNQEPDGNYLYISLQSDGDAESTNAANNPGKWQITPEGAKITWADGWTELLTKQGEQFNRMAWAPKVPVTDPPTDSTQAYKVGAVPARIAP